jgi:hypothetical protein
VHLRKSAASIVWLRGAEHRPNSFERYRTSNRHKCVTRWPNLFCYLSEAQIRNIEMRWKTPGTESFRKVRERAFEGAFFSVAIIAMVGWLCFIALWFMKLLVWFLD